MFQELQQQELHPNVLQWLDIDSDQEGATIVQAQPRAGSSGTPEQQNLASNNIAAQGEDSSLGHTASETPTVASQSTVGANSCRHQVAHQPVEARPWSDFEDEHTQANNTASTAASTQHRTVDIRTLQAAALPPTHHPRQRRTLWDSWRLNPRPTNEIIFLTVWLRVLREQDYETR